MQRYKKSPKWGKKCCMAWSYRTSVTVTGGTEGDSTGCVAKNGEIDAPQVLSATVNLRGDRDCKMLIHSALLISTLSQVLSNSLPTPCHLRPRWEMVGRG